MKNASRRLSIHHLFPKSRGGKNTPENKTKWRNDFHRVFHTIFANLLIDEQIELLLDIQRKVLDPDAIKLIEELIVKLNMRGAYRDVFFRRNNNKAKGKTP